MLLSRKKFQTIHFAHESSTKVLKIHKSFLNSRRTFPQPFVCVWARAMAMFSLLGSCVAALAL